MAKICTGLFGQTWSLVAGPPLEHIWGCRWLLGTCTCKGRGGAGVAEGLGCAVSVSIEPRADDHEASSGLWRCWGSTQSGRLAGEEHPWLPHSRPQMPCSSQKERESPCLLQCSSSTLYDKAQHCAYCGMEEMLKAFTSTVIGHVWRQEVTH